MVKHKILLMLDQQETDSIIMSFVATVHHCCTNLNIATPISPSLFITLFSFQGSCKFGEDCTFRHDCEREGGIESAKKSIVCPFFLKQGKKCRHKELCWFSHELFPEKNQDDEDESLDTSNTSSTETDVSSPTEKEETVENYEDFCIICRSHVIENGSRFALYPNCQHCVCYECAVKWHGSQKNLLKKNPENDLDHKWQKHECPLCREESEYIIPSKYFLMGEEKVKYFEEYKKKRALRKCNFFEIGRTGTCPRGKECFYAHLGPNGEDLKPIDEAMPKRPYMFISTKNEDTNN